MSGFVIDPFLWERRSEALVPEARHGQEEEEEEEAEPRQVMRSGDGR